MKRFSGGAALVGALFSALLTGCLSDETSVAGIEGTGGPVAVRGSVTSYGSIWVNGERINISDADIQVNGQMATEEAVELGMVVQVRARRDADGKLLADELRYRRHLLGSVEAVTESSASEKILQIFGRSVVVHDDALFANIRFDELAQGVKLDISGFVDPDGRLVAARVAQANDQAKPELRGQAKNLDRVNRRFEIGNLVVDYHQARISGGDEGDLAEGQTLQVRGTLSDGVMTAETLILMPEPELEEGERVSREGVIRQFESQGEFRIGGLSVNAADAEIVGGGANQLDAGVRVALTGRMAEGQLQAERVRLLLSGAYRTRGTVDSVDRDKRELVVMGTRYKVTKVTAYEDRGPVPNRFINLEAIETGDEVELFARKVGNAFTVTRVRRLDGDGGSVSLRGPVTQIDVQGGQIMIMNVPVELQNAADLALLADLKHGDTVTVSGEQDGGIILATELELPEVAKGRCEGECEADQEPISLNWPSQRSHFRF